MYLITISRKFRFTDIINKNISVYRADSENNI